MSKSIYQKANELAKKFFGEEKAQIGTLYLVFFAAIIILALIIIFTFIPGIGATVSQATPAAPRYGAAGGEWNATDATNPNSAALNASSGVRIWTTSSGMLTVAITIGIIVIILYALFGIFQQRRQPGGGGGPM